MQASTYGDVAVDDAEAVGANIDAPEYARVTSDATGRCILMLVIVDAYPGGTAIIRAEDALNAIDRSGGIHCHVTMAGSCHPEAN